MHWKQMPQTEAVAEFHEGEKVTVLQRTGNIKSGYKMLRHKGKVKRLLKTTLLIEWADKHGVVHIDRLAPERLERRA